MSFGGNAILGGVGGGIAGATPSAPVQRSYRRDGERPLRDRIDLLSERLVDYHANVRRAGALELRDAVEELARGRIGVPPGLPEEWRPAGAVEDHALRPHEVDA